MVGLHHRSFKIQSNSQIRVTVKLLQQPSARCPLRLIVIYVFSFKIYNITYAGLKITTNEMHISNSHFPSILLSALTLKVKSPIFIKAIHRKSFYWCWLGSLPRIHIAHAKISQSCIQTCFLQI